MDQSQHLLWPWAALHAGTFVTTAGLPHASLVLAWLGTANERLASNDEVRALSVIEGSAAMAAADKTPCSSRHKRLAEQAACKHAVFTCYPVA